MLLAWLSIGAYSYTENVLILARRVCIRTWIVVVVVLVVIVIVIVVVVVVVDVDDGA